MTESEMNRLLLDIRKELADYLHRSGSIFYTGRQAMRKGDFYLMGLNPGGDPGIMKEETIEKSLTDWRRREPEEWSEYKDVDWGKKKSDPKYENPGNSRHQKRVRSSCTNCLGEPDVRNVFSANAIFERTRKGDHLPKGTSLEHVCWQVHQLLFLKVQPKYIICLGHGLDSSFDRLKSEKCLAVGDFCEEAFKMPNGTRNFYIRWFEAAKIQNPLPGLERLVRIIGVPHPSWFDLGADWFSQACRTLPLFDSNPLRCKNANRYG